jgi:hypothetical protein
LAKLTVQVIEIENPTARGVMFKAPDIYFEMLDVINEVTAQYAPGA